MNRWTVTRSALLIFSLLVSLAGVSPASAAFETTNMTDTTKYTDSFAYTFCNGTQLQVSVKVNALTHTTQNDNRYTFVNNMTANGTATDGAGNKYVVNSSSQQIETKDVDPANPESYWNMRQDFSLTFIGKGGAPNVNMKSSYRLTVNSKGEITSFKLVPLPDCE